MDTGWRLAGLLLVAQRVVLGLVAVLAMYNVANVTSGGAWAELMIRGGEPLSLLLSTWQRWDALWYQHIVEAGYRAGDGSTAFYPLYPLLGKVVSLPLFGHTVWAELLVSSAAYMVALALLYRLARFEAVQLDPALTPAAGGRVTGRARRPSATASGRLIRSDLISEWAPRVGIWTVLLLALFPTGFFLLAPYTEGLFLALTVGAFLCARRGQWWLAGLLGFAAALTRPQGVLLVFPFVYEYVRQRQVVPWITGTGGRPPDVRALATVGPLAGLVAVTLYWRLALGEGGGVLDVQWMWGYQVVAPWQAIGASVDFLLHPPPPLPNQPNLPAVEVLNLAALVGFSVLAVIMVRRLPLLYAVYVWPSLGLLLFRQMDYSPLMSVARYVLVLFPCFLLLAMLVSRRPVVATALVVLGGALQVVIVWLFAQWVFVG